MSPQADRILQIFRARGLRSGVQLHTADFGDAIVWEGGFVRDESVRQALAQLLEDGYLIEHASAFELTPKGEQHVYSPQDIDLTARVGRLLQHDGR